MPTNTAKKTAINSTNDVVLDSQFQPAGWKGLRGKLFSRLMQNALGVVKPSDNYELPEAITFPPHMDSPRYGTTHYGIMIPDLPAPHHFMACATTLGGTGMRVFDTDHAVNKKDGPLNTAVLCHGTDAAADGHFTRYSIPQDVKVNEDGSDISFGNDLNITGTYPNFKMSSSRPGFSVNLDLTATGEITWFAYSKSYKHLSLLTRYEGTITTNGQEMPVKGLCTFEYARGASLYRLVNRPIPAAFKIPWDFFSYQVLNLDSDTQLCLAHCRMDGCDVLTGAYIRSAGKTAYQADGEVRFEVFTAQEKPAIAPDGRTTNLPKEFRWTINGLRGESTLEINATVDTEMLYGLGTGYIGGYKWEGTRNGKPVTGRGYIEFVDRREG